MGIWRSHHSIGNIVGSLIAGAFVEDSWGLSFAVPSAIIFGLGLLLYFFLVPDPRAVGCPVPEHGSDMSVRILFIINNLIEIYLIAELIRGFYTVKRKRVHLVTAICQKTKITEIMVWI
jgi:hypothetical protein